MTIRSFNYKIINRLKNKLRLSMETADIKLTRSRLMNIPFKANINNVLICNGSIDV